MMNLVFTGRCARLAMLGVCALTLFAQPDVPKTGAPSAKPAATTRVDKTAESVKPKTPPDQVAFAAARKIEDPVQKIAALNDVLAKHPKTNMQDGIRTEIFRATLKAYPKDKRLVMRTAKAVVKATPNQNPRYAHGMIAAALLRENVYLAEAEQYATKALAGYEQKQFYAERREQAAKAKRSAPTEAELLVAWNQARSGPLQTLGLLAIQAGRVAQGRHILTEVLRYDPMMVGANVGLAELAEKDGDEATALDYLLLAKLSGRIPENALGNLKRLYAKKHGSLDTLEGSLDQLYNTRFPSPLHVKRYEPTPERSGRVVLAEFFTGSGCPPCAAADLAFDAVLERYSRDEVALVVHHQHIPAPDPMAFPMTSRRFDFYKRGGVPTYVIDGEKDGGGGPRQAAQLTYDKINSKIEKRLNEPATATIALQAVRTGNAVIAKAAVEPITGDERDLRLHVILVEESLRYSGENGIRFHSMVVRGIGGPDTAEGIRLPMGKKYEGEVSFNIPAIVASLKSHLEDYEVNGNHGKMKFSQKMHEIDANRLAVIAFVQDAGSSAVLQSKFTNVGAQTAAVQ
jgi:thiol-disulfide isomerase/thioredoxin